MSAMEYTESAIKTAKALWGTEAEKARNHIEATAKSTHTVSSTPLTPDLEPVTRLRYGETP
ncbi:MAG: hypothetical protein NWF07_07770 [Candidatus Bathyarchaeota archaeon]|nr:hypothetical protein [Candidatus Bathyarchaeota archaeon]